LSREIKCTIVNRTSGAIQYNSNSKSSDSSVHIVTTEFDSGATAEAFNAKGPSAWLSGCSGEVVYNLPNGADQLVVVYNVSYTGQSAQIFAALQNQDGRAVGCDDYFVTVEPGSVTSTSSTPTVTVYDSTDGAQGKTGSVWSNLVNISVKNLLDSWITLNDFPDPKWDIDPIVTDGTTGIAPGGTAVILASAEAYEFKLIYNITNDYVLTIHQQKIDPPTAGFNVSCPYEATVSGSKSSSNQYQAQYTVTVQATTED
jgi:hypothetical protein